MSEIEIEYYLRNKLQVIFTTNLSILKLLTIRRRLLLFQKSNSLTILQLVKKCKKEMTYCTSSVMLNLSRFRLVNWRL